MSDAAELLAVALAGGLLASCATVRTPLGPCPRASVRHWGIAAERLVARETVEEAERNQIHDGVAFGGAHHEWERLKQQLRPGDQLWRFTRPRRPGLHGALEGYLAFRECRQVDVLVLVRD